MLSFLTLVPRKLGLTGGQERLLNAAADARHTDLSPHLVAPWFARWGAKQPAALARK